MSGKRKWALRVGLVAVLGLAAAGTWVGMNFTALQAKYVARQLRAAGDDDGRAKAADRLANLGDPGLAQLVAVIASGDEPCRAAAVACLDRHFEAMPAGDPRADVVAGRVLDCLPGADEGGRRAVLELLPVLLKKAGAVHPAKVREAVAAGLNASDPATRVLAVRLALHPDVALRAELVPLLAAPEAEVRRAALFAAASVTGPEVLVADEELFRWLHDPDEGVRKVCRNALVGRDRSDVEISLGRRLTHPDPSERLKLLLDLRYDDDVADPGPWLERLSRDPEPAVRAGAARVAVEVTRGGRLTCPGWVGRVADADPDATVRRVAAFFRNLPTRTDPAVRPVGGP